MGANLERFKQGHEAFNNRDFDTAAKLMAADCIYRDHARGVEYHGRDEMKVYLAGWTRAMSDAKIENTRYTEAGDVVVCEFEGSGTNDGPLGDLPPTNKQGRLDFCEIARFNERGETASIDCYYDQLSLLKQLGHGMGTEAEAEPAPSLQ